MPEIQIDLQHALENAIFIGKQTYYHLSEQELNDIKHWLNDLEVEHLHMPVVCLIFPRILKQNDYDLAVVYREGEHV